MVLFSQSAIFLLGASNIFVICRIYDFSGDQPNSAAYNSYLIHA